MTVYTIGHSTRPRDEFAALLAAFSIGALVDIRTIPGSRKNPQYNQTELAGWLAEYGIAYRHCRDLGGRRRPAKDSINSGWRNESFRGYADYMQTAEFDAALETLISLALERAIAIMCAEAVPWRCHRSLVGDALLVRGIEVRHITGPQAAKPHALTSWARVDGRRITYPGGEIPER